MSEAPVQEAYGRVVVTGANGFVGRHLCRSLVAKGVHVRGITRSTAGMDIPGVETANASDVFDRDGVRAALQGSDTIVHLAARVHAKDEGSDDPAAECRRINVEGTEVLLEEAVAAGVKKFVFISSVKAVAGVSDRLLTDDTAPQPVDPYGESKLAGERLLKFVAAREGLHAPILRLPVVYGPGMKANMATLFSAVEKGIPLPFGAVKNRRSFAYVGNVVEAIELLMVSPNAANATVYASDEEDLSTPQLVVQIARALGRPARLVPVPVIALKAGMAARGLLSRITPFHLKGDSLAAVVGSLFVDTSRLRVTTGYTPLFTVERGMATTAEWYKTRSQAPG